MGLFKDFFNEEGKGKEEIVSGKKLICSHCGNDRFINKSFMINNHGVNQTSENYICDKCGLVYWFYKLK